MLENWQHAIESYLTAFSDNIIFQATAVITSTFVVAFIIDRVIFVFLRKVAANTDGIFDHQFIFNQSSSINHLQSINHLLIN